LDSEFPEISQALLNLVYPGYLRPIPALSIAQFRLDPRQTAPPEGVSVLAGERLTIDNSCEFRTCYPVELWPVTVEYAAVLDAADIPPWAVKAKPSAAIHLRLSTDSFERLKDLQRLRFCLRGTAHAPYTVYELLFNHGSGILLRDPENPSAEPARLPPENIIPVGFEVDESLLRGGGPEFFSFRMLQEYLAFPEKFLFFDLRGLDTLSKRRYGKTAEILFLLDRNCPKDDRFRRLQFSTSPDSFSLGCTPIVNLFRKAAEPIRVSQRQPEYQVQPDIYRPEETEVFSVDAVRGRTFSTKSVRIYRPLFSFQHSQSLGDPQQIFWNEVRRRSRQKGDEGTDVFLSLVDLGLQSEQTPDETLLVELTCTNRDVPSRLDFSFDFTEGSRLRDSRVQWRLLQRPSRPLRPPLDRKIDWRLISLLGMNYLGLSNSNGPCDAQDSEGANALRELLALLDFSGHAAVRDRINAIRSVSSAPTRARVRMRREGEVVPVYCHGLAVEIDFDEEALAATGVFLFAAVLERFLAQYASMNSFTRLTATTGKGRRVLKEWPPRAGNQVLL
jgi:type VI secretion system protein ImpG